MHDLNESAGILSFGAFEVDLKTGEVRKHGLKIRLQEQSFHILSMLLERPGEGHAGPVARKALVCQYIRRFRPQPQCSHQ
jgi:DNA-binding response OmpR family regulator